MIDKLAATRFLAVVGTSGSGKSSLVNCGLKPALRRGLMASRGHLVAHGALPAGCRSHKSHGASAGQPGVLFRNPGNEGVSR